MNVTINFLFIVIGGTICLYSLNFSSNSAIDMELGNSYFVIAYPHILLAFGIPILLMGVGYLILEYYDFPLNKPLKWASIVLFTLSLLILYFIYARYSAISTPRRYYQFDNFSIYESQERMMARMKILKIIILVILFTFPFSFLLSLINWIRAFIISIS